MSSKFPLEILRSSELNSLERLPDGNDYFKDINNIRDGLEKEANNIDKWDTLFNAIDLKYDELIDNNADDELVNSLKQFSYNSYFTLLERLPLLSDYWKNWLIFEYKIKGVESSINILRLSVQKFPTSIDLWTDYLSALISQYESVEDEATKKEYEESIRFQYELAIKYNGANYNSHIIWDKIIEFENSINKDSKISRDLLLRVIRIPLYEYSKYFKEFFEINKTYELEEVLDKESLTNYLSKFGKLTSGELTTDEKNQIIDDYSYEIFSDIQRLVNEKWNYESSLLFQSFSIKNTSDIEKEVDNWVKYLDHEITSFQNKHSNLEIVENLFERALIPNCFNSKLWYKYLFFFHKSNLDENTKFEKMNLIYQRCCQKYMPLDDFNLKTSYVDFLMLYGKFEEANEFIIDLLKMYNSDSKSIYFKREYLESMTKLMELWVESSINKDMFLTVCEELIRAYFKKGEPPKKKTYIEHAKDEITENTRSIRNYLDALLQLINDDSICLIVNKFLEVTLISETPENFKTVRTFFNEFFREQSLQNSVKFWKFYIELEGIRNVNLKNLKNLIDYIKENVNLPKIIIDSFVDLYYDLVTSNMPLAIQSQSEIKRSIIRRDVDRSNSFFINQSMRKRLSKHNCHIKELEEVRLSRSQNFTSVNLGDEFLKMAKKHINHPGILVEALPEITNLVLEDDRLNFSGPSKLTMPPLPTFKNVEKASLPINYPE